MILRTTEEVAIHHCIISKSNIDLETRLAICYTFPKKHFHSSLVQFDNIRLVLNTGFSRFIISWTSSNESLNGNSCSVVLGCSGLLRLVVGCSCTLLLLQMTLQKQLLDGVEYHDNSSKMMIKFWLVLACSCSLLLCKQH